MSENKIDDINREIESLRNNIDIGVEDVLDGPQDISSNTEVCNSESLEEKLEQLKMDVKALKTIKKHQKKIEKLEEKKVEILGDIEERRRKEKKRMERVEKKKRKH